MNDPQTVAPETRIPSTPPPDQAELFQQAVELHQAGDLYEAGKLYQSILQQDPNHPEANHKLGIIAVQAGQPDAGLPHFVAALNADPSNPAYWLGYLDALIQARQYEEARSVMTLARQYGLAGEAAEIMEARIVESQAAVTPAGTSPAENSPPRPDEIQNLLALFGQNRIDELEQQARAMAHACPWHPFGWKMLGIALQVRGDNRAAIVPMQKALERDRGDVENHYNLGVAFQALGELENAAQCYKNALSTRPDYADAVLNLGVIHHRLGRLAEAESLLRRAIDLLPDSAMAHGNLGLTLQESGHLAEAESCFRQCVRIIPDSFVALNQLGVVLQRQNRHPEAESCFRRALEINPNDGDAHANLAISLREQDRLAEAELSLKNALRIRPDDTQLLNNLAIVMQGQGQLDEANTHLQMAVHLAPRKADLWGNWGNLLRHMGQLDLARHAYRQALQLVPDNTEYLARLGDVYRQMRNYDEAEPCYRKAREQAPDDLDISIAWGITIARLGHLDEAESCFRLLLEKSPGNPSILNDLCQVLHLLGRLDEAAAYQKEALRQLPYCASFFSNWLYYLLHSEATDMALVAREHFLFGERFEPLAEGKRFSHPSTQAPERKLRIGFVSADFYNHAVFHFIEPILQPLKEHIEISLHAYYNNYINDHATRQLKSGFDHWLDVANWTDYQLAERIHADEIDILIDLSGHTGNNRLLSFTFKPAPLQASWIGYPATTGLRAIDYYFADRYYLPAGKFDDQFTEKIVRLPAIAPFHPSPDAPAINTLPALSNGFFTFGSFNRPNKLSREVIAMWSELLRALPDSKMLLGGMAEESGRQHILDWFAEEGIVPERLRLHARTGMNDYLRLHHQVDMCLDTFPYNGGTTTNHALWMGIPTLTLAGGNMAGRHGAANLSHAGLEEFIVESPAEFTQRGIYWASHLTELAAIRAGLRERLLSSPLRDPGILATGFAQALRRMWRQYCAGLPAESFEIEIKAAKESSR